MEIVALIPARSGSKRLPGKNTLMIGGLPLFAWTLNIASTSNLFKNVVVSSDSELTLKMAKEHGDNATIAIHTPLNHPIIHQDHSDDFPWIEHALVNLKNQGKVYDAFCILRPTNPFRSFNMLQAAIILFMDLLKKHPEKDYSIRAVGQCHQHPYKMWQLAGDKIIPFAGGDVEDRLYTQPYQKLPSILAQNASLEIGFTETVLSRKNHTGSAIYPFYTQGIEGFDIHTPLDFEFAQYIVETRVYDV